MRRQAVAEVRAAGHRARVLAHGCHDIRDFVRDVEAEDVHEVVLRAQMDVIVDVVYLGKRKHTGLE